MFSLHLTSLFFLVVAPFPLSAWSLCRAVLAACFVCVGVVVVVSCDVISLVPMCACILLSAVRGAGPFCLGRVRISHGGFDVPLERRRHGNP